jgi:F-type H+-transporting ATPase subunit gamma
MLAIGRKGRDYFKRRGYPIEKEYINVLKSFDYSTAQEIGRELTALFVDGKYDEISIVFPEFKSMISQKPTLDPLFPVASPKSGAGTAGDYIYEPSQAEILDTLLGKHIEGRIYRALLETSASEHGARMAAMDSATNNSTEMIFSLTLKMNKARQASITKELMDIVNGAEALKS